MSCDAIDPSLSVGQRFIADDNDTGARGWIRYIGHVASAPDPLATYIGVEWDDPTRGRHNGTIGDHQYFQCDMGRGAMIHPQRVLSPQSLADAIAARYAAHLDKGAEEEMYLLYQTSDVSATKRVNVEFVGADKALAKQSQLKRLMAAGVPFSRVNSAGAPGVLKALAPNINQLDLEGNLLSSWSEIAAIADELTLQELRLSSNHLIDDITVSSSSSASMSATVSPLVRLRTSFRQLRTLVLNSVPNAWTSIVAISSANTLPSLEELYVCYNNINRLTTANSSTGSNGSASNGVLTCFQSLRVLDLSNNAIDQWTDVMTLAYLPKLQRLVLNENQLTSIDIPSSAALTSSSAISSSDSKEVKAGATGVPFASLCALSLQNNRLTDWQSCVASLLRLPLLAELRLAGNHHMEAAVSIHAGVIGPSIASSSTAATATDVTAGPSSIPTPLANGAAAEIKEPSSSSTAATSTSGINHIGANMIRFLVIASLPNLRRFNLSEVRRRERADAERQYVKYFYGRSIANQGATATTAAVILPARYTSLVAIYGDPSLEGGNKGVAPPGTSSTDTAGTSLASRLAVITIVSPSGARVEKKIPLSMTIHQLKRVCDAVCKLAAKPFSIHWRDSPTTPLSNVVPLDDDMRSVSFYNISSSSVGGEIIVRLL